MTYLIFIFGFILCLNLFCIRDSQQNGFSKNSGRNYGSCVKVPPYWTPDSSTIVHSSNVSRYEETKLPDHFDARVHWPACAQVISRISDQAHCGACWAIAVTDTISDRLCIASNGSIKVAISAQDLLECSWEQGCAGGWPHSAWQHFIDNGLVTGGGFGSGLGCKPYIFECNEATKNCPNLSLQFSCQEKCENPYYPNYDSTDGSETQLKEIYEKDKYYGKEYFTFTGPVEIGAIKLEIYKNGPVTAILDNQVLFNCVGSDICSQNQNQNGEINLHAVRIIGWGVGQNGTGYWLVANSWGRRWHENGVAKVQFGHAMIERNITFGTVILNNDGNDLI